MKLPRLWIVLGVVVVVLASAVLMSGFINYRQEDINIKTGRARHARYVFFLKMSQAIEDTPLSVALEGQVIDVSPIQAWHSVNTLRFGTRSCTHYAFSDALVQARELTLLSETYDLTPPERTNIAREVLTRWQMAGRDSSAEGYLRDVMMKLDAARKTSVEPVRVATVDDNEPSRQTSDMLHQAER
jgi:hypothetical protein